MPGQDSADPRGSRAERLPVHISEESLAQEAADLAAALAGLDRAAMSFRRRLQDAGAGPAEPAQGAFAPPPEGAIAGAADAAIRARMQEARQEVQAYLAGAKARADRVVRSMVDAVERQSSEMLADAERDIEARRRRADADAARQLDAGRRAADCLVAERHERIAALSDDISRRALNLTAGMDDAEQVREQFAAFIRALSASADQIAREEPGGAGVAELRNLRRRARSSSLAA